MTKQTFTATYNGTCYIKAHGRKLYKRGVSLTNVAHNGTIIFENISIAQTKALENLSSGDQGRMITFEGVQQDDVLKYISNVSVI